MKKNHIKAILIMSAITFWSFLISCICTATLLGSSPSDAQSVKDVVITVGYDDAPLLEVFNDIEGKTDFTFLYHQSAIKSWSKHVNIGVTTATVAKVLQHVMDQTGLRFQQINSTIAVNYPDISELIVTKVRTGTISGRVTDASTGDPLLGVNVYIEATAQGASTDEDGEFHIFNIEPGTYNIRISYIGYKVINESVQIIDGQTTELVFGLVPKTSLLDEIVVTGYSVQREIPTGAITTIEASAFEVRSVQTLDQAIQAQSPGLRMVNLSGQPGAAGAIIIRGVGSINAGNEPLFIVDGTIITTSYLGDFTSGNIFGALNPADIESVTILRDAEATALYGAKGANGVVLITTKRGQAGGTRFSATSQVGIAMQTFKYDLMNGPEWVRFMQEANANRYEDLGITEYGGVEYDSPREAGRQAAIDTYGHPDAVNTYDWQEATMNTPAFQQRFSLSAQGGTDITQFYLSGSYSNVEGTFIGSNFSRMTLRANIDHQATDKLRFELNANMARLKTNGRAGQTGITSGTNSIESPWHGGVTTAVTTPIYNEDGSWNQDIPAVTYNTVQLLHEEVRWSRRLELIGNLSATYIINDNFSFRSRWGLNYRPVRDYRYRNPSVDQWAENGGYVDERLEEITSWNTDQVLDYVNTFGEAHNVNAILGAEYRRMYRSEFMARGRGLPTAHFFNTIDATTINNSMGGTFGEYRKAGVFSRLTYNYDERYYATANVRYDGSSRFGKNNRWGLFYSGSLAWDIAGESFMDNVDFVDELKPRISYGITGNSSIGFYASLTTFQAGSGAYGGGNPLFPGQLGNSDLTWETARTIDFGLDWSLFEGRFYGYVDFYRKDSEDLLLNRDLPNNSGFFSVTQNVGTVRWEGVEAQIGGVLFQIGDFAWQAEFNFTYERSEVLELVDGQESIGNSIHVGGPRRVRWGQYYAGVNPANGHPMWYDADGNLTYTVVEDDHGPIGKFYPDFYGGLSSRLNYGPVSLRVLFQYQYGRDLRNYTHNVFMMRPHRGPRTLSTDMFARWQQPGDITDVPRAYTESAFPGSSTYNSLSTLDMEDGSFIRLKNAVLQYQFPVQWVEAIGLRGASIYVQGENLLTWTAFTGPDPEVRAQTRAIYPQPRTFMGGITIDF